MPSEDTKMQARRGSARRSCQSGPGGRRFESCPARWEPSCHVYARNGGVAYSFSIRRHTKTGIPKHENKKFSWERPLAFGIGLSMQYNCAFGGGKWEIPESALQPALEHLGGIEMKHAQASLGRWIPICSTDQPNRSAQQSPMMLKRLRGVAVVFLAALPRGCHWRLVRQCCQCLGSPWQTTCQCHPAAAGTTIMPRALLFLANYHAHHTGGDGHDCWN